MRFPQSLQPQQCKPPLQCGLFSFVSKRCAALTRRVKSISSFKIISCTDKQWWKDGVRKSMALIQNVQDDEGFPCFLDEHPNHKGAAFGVCLPAPVSDLVLVMSGVCSVILAKLEPFRDSGIGGSIQPELQIYLGKTHGIFWSKLQVQTIFNLLS